MHLYLSRPEHCGYLPGREALNLFADPHRPISPQEYNALVQSGFRRSGEFVYRPHCPGCTACIPVRIRVRDFRPNRSQKRTLRDNADIQTQEVDPCFREEHFALYSRYQNDRHPGGSMANASREDYLRFLTSSWSDTRFVEFRSGDELLAVTVYDVLLRGLSAVYCFYAPEAGKRALGKLAVLWEIARTRELGFEYLYLGYWIAACDKMRYKAEYQPLEIYCGEHWLPFAALQSTGQNYPIIQD